ncbi:MAG: cytochrome c1, partial [Sulfuricella sp.]|nr:cytochrome c1 [Sulfuricella sp.]
MKKILFLVSLLASTMAFASGDIHLDKAPTNLSDQQSLQRGAKTFVNYCLSCHSAQAMRYNRLQDIGLTEQQIKDNLIFTGAKVGDTMTNNMSKKDAKAWFGATPPDLSVISRSRGADWLYTYLRGFYRDETRPTGWNNVAFDKVGMPHVLYELQGEQVLHVEK